MIWSRLLDWEIIQIVKRFWAQNQKDQDHLQGKTIIIIIIIF